MAGSEEWGRVGVLTPPDVADRSDLDAFCRREYVRLVGMMGLYCGDGHLAEDLTQEALARLCRHWADLPTDEDARRWVTRVAMNLAKTSFRARSGRQRILDHYGASIAAPASPSAERSSALAVRAAVARLPERQRRVVILRYFCDMPVAEVSSLMGCPEGTVKSLTSLAVTSLRRSGLEFTDD